MCTPHWSIQYITSHLVKWKLQIRHILYFSSMILVIADNLASNDKKYNIVCKDISNNLIFDSP
jgi:hypothetical protein